MDDKATVSIDDDLKNISEKVEIIASHDINGEEMDIAIDSIRLSLGKIGEHYKL